MRRAGFTLVELLVAFALLALLGLAATGMIRFGDRAWRATEARASTAQDLVQADLLLRRALRGIVRPSALDNSAPGALLFFGAADGFGWVGRAPALGVAPGVYGLRLRADAGRVILESWSLAAPAAIRTTELLAAPAPRFAYFGRTARFEAPSWRTSWPAGRFAPSLVRIEIDGAPPMVIGVDANRSA